MIADVRLQQLVTDREPWSSYVERLRGGIATITRYEVHSLNLISDYYTICSI